MTTVKGSTLNRGLNAADKPYYVRDLPGSDQTSALQSAINDAQTTGQDLRIPSGRIEHTGLTLPAGFSIRIDAEQNGTSFTKLVNTSATASTFTALGGVVGGVIEGLNIAHEDGAPSVSGAPNGSSGTAIIANNPGSPVIRLEIKNCIISGHASGITIANAQNCTIDAAISGTSVLDGTNSTGVGITLLENGGTSYNCSISDSSTIYNCDIGIDSFCDNLNVGACSVTDYASAGFRVTGDRICYINQARFESQASYNPVSSILDVSKTAYIHHYLGTLGSNDSLQVDVAAIGSAGQGRYAVTQPKNSKAYMFPTSRRTVAQASGGMNNPANWRLIQMDSTGATTPALRYGLDTEGIANLGANVFEVPETGSYNIKGQVMVQYIISGVAVGFGNLKQCASIVVNEDPGSSRIVDCQNNFVFTVATPGQFFQNTQTFPVDVTAFLEKGDRVSLYYYWRQVAGGATTGAVSVMPAEGPDFDRDSGAGTAQIDPPMATFLQIVGPID